MLDMRGEFIGRGLLETGGDLLQQGRLIGLDRQEIGNHRKTLKQLRCRSFGTASSMAGHPQRLWLSTNHTSLAEEIPFSTSSR
jgi:hypothetical protein